MVDNIKLFLIIQQKHLKSAFLSKADMLLNIFMMLINNFSFGFMWWVIFRNRETVNGWSFDDMLIVFAVTCNAFWLYASFFRGIDNIYRYIDNGNLDNFLVSPRSPLFMLSTSHVTVSNWGDLFTGILAFFLSSYVSVGNFFLMLLCSFLAFMLFFGFQLVVSSFAFRNKNAERLGHNCFIALLIFMHQPASIFVGWYKILILTAIPVAYMSLFPVEVIRSFSWASFTYMVLGCSFFFFGGIYLFQKGLKEYSSGNRFGIR